jgi:hypothetical protein
MMSGCKTLNVVGEKEENHDTINMSEPLVADTISDTITKEIAVVNEVKTDSLLLQDTVKITEITADTVVKNDTVLVQPKTTPQKESFVEDKIERTCSDSTIQDFRNNKIYYYGDAKVVYEDITIEAAYIEFDMDKRTVFAKGLLDSVGKLYGNPVFLEGDKKYLSESMTFNFETKKGVITKVFTEDAMGYIHGK